MYSKQNAVSNIPNFTAQSNTVNEKSSASIEKELQTEIPEVAARKQQRAKRKDDNLKMNVDALLLQHLTKDENNNENENDRDPDTMFLLSHAETLKSFPPRKKQYIKLKICELFYENTADD